MSDEKALLAAIWEHPHEDAPRLVYADWLEEHGQPERAEFIRVQCALAKLEPWDDHPQRAAWQTRAAELWGAAAKKFRRALTPQLRKDPFRRGFVEPQRQAFAKKFLKLTDVQLAEAPLWSYTLQTGLVGIDGLLGFRGVRRVGWLSLNDHISGSAGAARFTQSANLGNLAALDWRSSLMRTAGIQYLGAARNVPNLTRLNIRNADLGETGAQVFGESHLAGQLTALSIGSNKLTPAAVKGLFAPGKFHRLASLEMGYEENGNKLLAALPTGNRLPELRHLRLLTMELTPAGAEALAAWPGAASLRHLEVWDEIGVGGVRHLVRSPHLRNLLALDLSPSDPNRDTVTKLLRERFGTVGRVGPYPDSEGAPLRGGRLPGHPPSIAPHAGN